MPSLNFLCSIVFENKACDRHTSNLIIVFLLFKNGTLRKIRKENNEINLCIKIFFADNVVKKISLCTLFSFDGNTKRRYI